MQPPLTTSATLPFNEDEWLRLLFLLSDTQHWLNELANNTIQQLPVANKKKLFHRSYYLNIQSLAHIIERHYYKVVRHPGAGKFTLSIPELVACLRDASTTEPIHVPGKSKCLRVIDKGITIGYDRKGMPTSIITIVTDSGGCIITAFPGEE